MTIIEKARDNYNKVIEYHNSIHYDTRLDQIWSNNMGDIAQIVNSSATAEELIDKIDQTFMYAINFPPENGMDTGVWKSPSDVPHIREKQIEWLFENLKFELPEGVEESPFIHSRNKSMWDGKVVSGNFLRTMSIAHEVFTYTGKPKSILELGGGAGHQARSFLLQIPDCKYTIVDLPETLFFSFTHLSLCFPDKKILYVSSEEDVEKIDEHDLVFVPAVFADKLHGKSYDLFVNTASLGEMRNDVIHYWMDFIQNKVSVKYLFTLNRFLNVIDYHPQHHRLGENECSTSYDHKWEIINWELEPVYTRCPYIDTLHSRYVQIVAKRGQGPENCQELSDKYLKEAQDEDWYRLAGMYGGGVMQYRANILVNDMTMNGPLFKIWQSIRYDQNQRNVATMLEYLKRIVVQGHEFEEKFYYQNLLRRLAA